MLLYVLYLLYTTEESRYSNKSPDKNRVGADHIFTMEYSRMSHENHATRFKTAVVADRRRSLPRGSTALRCSPHSTCSQNERQAKGRVKRWSMAVIQKNLVGKNVLRSAALHCNNEISYRETRASIP